MTGKYTIRLLLALAIVPGAAQAEDLPTTRAGLDAAVASHFAMADTNHDGGIDRSEASAMLGVAATELSRHPKAQALFNLSTGPDGRPQLSMNGGGVFDMMFAQIDRNGDGLLSLPEIQAEARARFDAADSNHDGKLSGSELTVARNQLGILQQALGGAR